MRPTQIENLLTVNNIRRIVQILFLAMDMYGCGGKGNNRCDENEPERITSVW